MARKKKHADIQGKRSARNKSEGKNRGLKASTVGTTVYLIPDESWRVKQLAVRLRTSVHQIILSGLDRILAEHGQPPIRRYKAEPSRRPKAEEE